MIANYDKPVAKTMSVGCCLAALISMGLASADEEKQGDEQVVTAGDASPYLIGHWSLTDSFSDFSGGSEIKTPNSEFIFLNPTGLTLTLEYAFFSNESESNKVGAFCGCDRDTLHANGRVRYTMLGESQLSPPTFDRKLCPSPHNEGTMKTIVFLKEDGHHNVVLGGALQAGYQIDFFPGGRTQSSLLAVPVSKVARDEIQSIHKACNRFLGPPAP
jgi:hypothetical protein